MEEKSTFPEKNLTNPQNDPEKVILQLRKELKTAKSYSETLLIEIARGIISGEVIPNKYLREEVANKVIAEYYKNRQLQLI